MYVVYEHWLDGRCFWVGSGTKYRPKNFGSRKRAWQEYVKDRQNDIIIKIVKEFETREEAYEYEIEHHKNMLAEGHPIQNLLGNAGYWTGKKRPEISEKLSKSLTGRHLTEEHKHHISQNHSKWNKGIPMSDESKKKLSNSIREKYATDETYREKCRLAQQRRRERERLASSKGRVV